MAQQEQMQGNGSHANVGIEPPPHGGSSERDRRERDSRRDDKDRHSSRSDRDRERDRERDRDRDRRDKDRSSRDKDRGRDDKKPSSSSDKRRSSSKDRSSSKRKRSPSPDLVYKKKRTGWDQMPTGLEIFTQPAVIKPTIGSVFNNLNAQAKQQKRLYVGNVPATVQDDELIEFFNRAMVSGRKTTQPGNPIIACQMNRDKAYAFLEFRTAEEASAGMSLDGINLQGHALKVRRPKDYVPTAGEEHIADPTVPNSDGSTGPSMNIVSTNVEDTPNKIFIGGVPPNLNEADVRELLQVFGALKSFNLVRDTTTGASKGYAFCEYLDPNMVETACKGLNGMKIVDKNLVVQRASVGSKGTMAMAMGGKIREPTNIAAASLMNLVAPLPTLLKAIIKDAKPVEPTKILVLLNCVNVDDFPEGQAYDNLVEDIKEECKKHGRVRQVVVPQPPVKPKPEMVDGQMVTPQPAEPEPAVEVDPLVPRVPGLGKIFIEFSKVEDARRAQVALGGRRYDGRLVITTFFDEEKFHAGDRRVTLAHLAAEQSPEDLQALQRQQAQFAAAAMHNQFVKGDDAFH